MKRLYLLLILLLFFLFIFIILNLRGKSKFYKFYYPQGIRYGLVGEYRFIENINGNKEKLVIEHYLLGPINYLLKQNINKNISLNNIWIVKNKKEKILIINLKWDIDSDIKNNYIETKFFIDGLIRTIKENLKINKIFILINGELGNYKIDFYNLLYPIVVK